MACSCAMLLWRRSMSLVADASDANCAFSENAWWFDADADCELVCALALLPP